MQPAVVQPSVVQPSVVQPSVEGLKCAVRIAAPALHASPVVAAVQPHHTALQTAAVVCGGGTAAVGSGVACVFYFAVCTNSVGVNSENAPKHVAVVTQGRLCSGQQV